MPTIQVVMARRHGQEMENEVEHTTSMEQMEQLESHECHQQLLVCHYDFIETVLVLMDMRH